VFLQNYRARGIFGINELFFYRKFGGIGPRSTDRVHGGRSTSARTPIRWEPSADRSTAQIKTWEGVSDNLVMVVNTGMDDSRQGRRDRDDVPDPRRWLTRVSRYERSGSPNSTRSSPTASWWRRDLDSFTLGWQRTMVAAGDGEANRRKLGVDSGRLWGSSG
jgi:hypothetical protein